MNEDNECPSCEGYGTIDIGPICFKPMSQCCGGCYETETCSTCNGIGHIETENE